MNAFPSPRAGEGGERNEGGRGPRTVRLLKDTEFQTYPKVKDPMKGAGK